jgi:hypothetical protein
MKFRKDFEEHKVDTLRKQGVFIGKIGQKVPQMAHVWFDQGAIMDKLFWTQPFWHGLFGGLFGWFLY